MSQHTTSTLDDRLTAVLTGACRAALAYDAAIQRAASDHGKEWTGGDDLDALYVTWIRLAREAVGDTGETLPPGDDEISPGVRAKLEGSVEWMPVEPAARAGWGRLENDDILCVDDELLSPAGLRATVTISAAVDSHSRARFVFNDGRGVNDAKARELADTGWRILDSPGSGRPALVAHAERFPKWAKAAGLQIVDSPVLADVEAYLRRIFDAAPCTPGFYGAARRVVEIALGDPPKEVDRDAIVEGGQALCWVSGTTFGTPLVGTLIGDPSADLVAEPLYVGQRGRDGFHFNTLRGQVHPYKEQELLDHSVMASQVDKVVPLCPVTDREDLVELYRELKKYQEGKSFRGWGRSAAHDDEVIQHLATTLLDSTNRLGAALGLEEEGR